MPDKWCRREEQPRVFSSGMMDENEHFKTFCQWRNWGYDTFTSQKNLRVFLIGYFRNICQKWLKNEIKRSKAIIWWKMHTFKFFENRPCEFWATNSTSNDTKGWKDIVVRGRKYKIVFLFGYCSAVSINGKYEKNIKK